MLQRKQTLWMLLAVICAALTFKFSFYSGNVVVGKDGHVFLEEKAVPVLSFGKDSAGAGSVLILIVTVVLLAGLLINIFNYKARSKQLWITIGLIFLSLLNIFSIGGRVVLRPSQKAVITWAPHSRWPSPYF
jgi:hypothetical protein